MEVAQEREVAPATSGCAGTSSRTLCSDVHALWTEGSEESMRSAHRSTETEDPDTFASCPQIAGRGSVTEDTPTDEMTKFHADIQEDFVSMCALLGPLDFSAFRDGFLAYKRWQGTRSSSGRFSWRLRAYEG